MAFWNRDKGSASRENAWSKARIITEEEAGIPGLEFPGWYIYRNQAGRVFSLRPNPDTKKFDKMEWPILCKQETVSQWLGKDIPAEFFDEAPKAAPPVKPRDTISSVPVKKKAGNRKRNCQFLVRFSTSEYARFLRRAEDTGLSKNEFALRALLDSEIVLDVGKQTAIMQLCQELKETKAELGRQGGMLKMVIQPNKGQRELHPEEWDSLIQFYNSIEKSKKSVEKTLVNINGYFEA